MALTNRSLWSMINAVELVYECGFNDNMAHAFRVALHDEEWYEIFLCLKQISKDCTEEEYNNFLHRAATQIQIGAKNDKSNSISGGNGNNSTEFNK